MPKTVKYIGTTNRWPELAVTGKQSVWMPGQMDERPDSEAALLLATGLFADQDALNQTPAETAALAALVSRDGIGRLPARVYNPRGLRRWRTAIAAAEYAAQRINVIGTSLTVGAYCDDSTVPVDATGDSQSWAGRLRAMVNRRLGTTPGGFIPANDSRNTVTGTSVTSSCGPFMHTIRTSNVETLGGALNLPNGATISIPVPSCTTMELIWLDSGNANGSGNTGANTGSFTWSLDGGAQTGSNTAVNTAPVNYRSLTITASQGAHTLLLTGGSPGAIIIGVNYHSGNGVIVNRWGVSGGSSLDVTGEGFVGSGLNGGARQRLLSWLSAPLDPVAAGSNINAATTAGSDLVTLASSASAAGVKVGMPISASSGNADIPVPCYVKALVSDTVVQLSVAATGTNAARPLRFGGGLATAGNAALWIIEHSHNDWVRQNSTGLSTVPAFRAQLQRLIDAATASGACVLLVGDPRSNATVATGSEVYRIDEYFDAIKALAAANDHCAAVLIADAWGTFDQGKALALQSDASGVHPLRRGHADMARAVDMAIWHAGGELAAAA